MTRTTVESEKRNRCRARRTLMRTALRAAVAPALAAGVIAGCNAGPDYHRPALTLAQQFSTWPSTQPATAPTTRSVVAAHAPPLTDLAHWWESMHDPELNRLLTLAVQRNLNVQMAVARLQESRQLLAIFAGGTLPALDLSGVAGGGTSSNITRGGQVDAPLSAAVNTSGLRAVTQALGVDTAFELDLFGNLRREGQVIAADTAAAAELRNQVLVALLGDVARSYVAIRTLQQRINIAQQAIAAQQQVANVTHERFNRGITNELDPALADREVESTEAALPPLQAQLLTAKRNLAVLLDEEPDALLRELDQTEPLPRPPAAVDTGLPIDLLRRRPDVRQAEAQLMAATARLGVATSLLYPRIFLTAAGGIEGEGLGRPTAWRGIWEAAPALNWPLLDFGTVDARIAAQDQETRAQLANFQNVVLRAVADVDNSLTNYDAERRRLQSLSRAVAAAQHALDLANQRYERGIIDFLNVLDAERSLYMLQDQQAVSEDVTVANFVNVCQSLGGGWEGFAPPPPLKAPLPAILAAARDVSGHSDNPLR